MSLTGNIFAKPFCRLASTIAVFLFLFGLVALIENSSSGGTFFVFCTLFALVLFGLAGFIAKDSDGTENTFSLWQNNIYAICTGTIILMFVGAITFVQIAPTSRPDGDTITRFYTDHEKAQVWVAYAISTLMYLLVIFYTSRFGDNVDEYSRHNVNVNSKVVNEVIKYLRDNHALPDLQLYGYITSKLPTVEQQIQAVKRAQLTQVTQPDKEVNLLNLIFASQSYTKYMEKQDQIYAANKGRRTQNYGGGDHGY
jgi:hypothetical protein